MRIKQLIAAVAVLSAASPVLAEEWVDFSGVVSTKTRAEVISEFKQAQADGTLAAGRSEYVEVFAPPAPGTERSRAEVRAEAIDAAKYPGSSVKDIYFGG